MTSRWSFSLACRDVLDDTHQGRLVGLADDPGSDPAVQVDHDRAWDGVGRQLAGEVQQKRTLRVEQVHIGNLECPHERTGRGLVEISGVQPDEDCLVGKLLAGGDELDLVREAANAAQLRRNMADLDLVLVPEMHWDLCSAEVLVMERMKGVPISQMERLVAAGIDIKKLARDGVTIFFTQVFRDGFFHADMHPGNIQVSIEPATFGRYVALDFGIIGTLTETDKDYLAQNFIAFFRRDYKRVAELHIASGWVPPETRVDALESAVRAVCEPHFDRPLKDISLGQVLMRLFQTSRRFNVEIQPQLVLLQKTLLNIEGLGRQLDPELDLWATAKPFLERWMQQQVGWPALREKLSREAPRYAQFIPEMPRLLHDALKAQARGSDPELRALVRELRSTNRMLALVLWAVVGFALGVAATLVAGRWFGDYF